MKLQDSVATLLPTSFRLPFKFYYQKFRNRLEPELLYLPQLPRKGSRAIDIGANYGFYSYALSRLYSCVEAFEPQPWCTKDLEAYKKVCSNTINIYNVGLADIDGTLNLNIPTSAGDYSELVPQLGGLTTGLASFQTIAGGGECKNFDVEVKKLDDYHFDDVGLIKIDVEGFESKVIDGGLETIGKNKPTVIMEVESRHLKSITMLDVFEKLFALDYNGFFVSGNSLNSITPFLDNIATMGNSFLNNHDTYINNFIFICS